MPFGTSLQDEQQERRTKSLYLIGAVAVFFSILIFRLFILQIIQGQLNIRLSKENSMQLKVLVPPRGRLLDRNGEVLARNRPSYSICVLPYKVKNRKKVMDCLLQIRDTAGTAVFDSAELNASMQRALYRRFEMSRLKEDVSMDLVSVVEEHSMELPGITVETESRREYTMGGAAFHVLGYMSEIPETDFDSLKDLGYYYGDLMGKSGLERQYEPVVRGTCGREYLEVNAYGKSLGPVPDLPRVEPIPGNDLRLTIDARLQRIAAQSFPDTFKGAVVALDPRNGEVLVMYSNPSVDPNIFSMSASFRSKNWSSIALDPALPLNNRVTGGTYTPGSTFKLVSSVSGLASGQLTANSRMPASCTGAYRFGGRIAHCWEPRGHGYLDLIDAVAKSCDVYFYQVGLRLGDVLINKYADELGLGKKTGIDLPSEREGWLSGEEAYNKRWKRRGWTWTRGLLLDMAIGQTQVVTPIQLAMMVGGLGNGKEMYRPFLVKEELDENGKVVKQHQPEVTNKLDFSPEVLQTIHTAMEHVIQPGGTGGRAAVPGIPVGGKTGSAQNPAGKTHALFIACAPVDDPVIAVAVVVENAGHGGSMAAPVAGDIMRYYFAHTDEGQRILQKYSPDVYAKQKLEEQKTAAAKDSLAAVLAAKKGAQIKISKDTIGNTKNIKPNESDISNRAD